MWGKRVIQGKVYTIERHLVDKNIGLENTE